MKTLALYNLKGGVGKTAAAVNLAFLAAEHGKRTLLWDLDPQGAATWYLSVDPGLEGGLKRIVKGKSHLGGAIRPTVYERLTVLPADFATRNLDLLLKKADDPKRRLKEMLDELDDDLDLVVLDCPPGLSLLTENVFHAADVIAVPMIPTPLSVRAYEQMVAFLAHEKIRKVKLYPFLSLVDSRRKVHHEHSAELRDKVRTLLNTEIPYSSIVERMGRWRAPLPAVCPHETASKRFEALWLEIAELL